MKTKLLTTFILSTLILNAFAQTEKGRFAISAKTDLSMMAGKTSLVTDSAAGQSQKTLALNANIGIAYFVVDNLALSVTGSLTYQGVKPENHREFIHTYTAAIIPGVTFFIPLQGNLKPTISAGAGYVWYSTINTDAEGWSFNAAPGLAYFISEKISFDLGMQYTFNRLTNTYMGENYRYNHQAVGLLAGISIYF